MTLGQGERLLAAFFASCGIYCVVVGMRFPYYNRLGPGPGFFPIWIGVLLAGLSLGILVNGLVRPAPGAANGFFEDRAAAARVIGTFLFLILATWLLGYLGFRLTMLVFAALAPLIIARQNPVAAAGVALACSFGTAYAFEHWLGVQLPHAALPVLRGLGL